MLTRRLKFAPLVLALSVGVGLLVAALVSASAPATASAATSSTYTVRWHRSVHVLGRKAGGFTGISCAALNQCVGVDAYGQVVWSTRPGTHLAKYWHKGRVDKIRGGLTGISCPNKSFCAAVDAGGRLIWTTKPTGGAKGWSKPVRIDRVKSSGGGYVGLAAIACASAKLCVAVDNAPSGNVLVSHRPTGGRRRWHRVTLGSGQQLTSVACPSTSLCVVSGNETYYATSVHARLSDWTAAANTPGNGVISAVGCAKGTTACVAVGYNNTSPGFAISNGSVTTGGWSSSAVESDPPGPTEGLISGVQCPHAGFCVALDTNGNAYLSNSPAAGDWVGPNAVRSNSASISAELACTKALCVAVDNRGVVTGGRVRT